MGFDVGAHGLEGVEDAGAEGVEADVADGDFGVGVEDGGGDPEGGGGDVAGDVEIEGLEVVGGLAANLAAGGAEHRALGLEDAFGVVAGGGGLAQDGGAVGAQGGEDDGGLDLGAGDGDVEFGAVEAAGGDGQGCVGAVRPAVDAGAEGAEGAHDAVHGAGAQGGVAGEDGVEGPAGEQAAGEAHGGAAVAAVEDVGGFAEAVEAEAGDRQLMFVHRHVGAERPDEGGAGAGVGAEAGVAQASLAAGLGAEQQAPVGDGLVAGDRELAAQAARRLDDAGAGRGGGHAPTGAPTGRPRAAAIGSSWAISSLKCLKLRLCWPSIRADSGEGWTSTMMPSAPAATEARAME